VLLTTCSVAHAQWTVFDPVADGYYLPEQQLATLDVVGQNVEQNVNWISQLQHNISEEAHNVQQDITENATYLEAAQIYTTAQSTFKTAVQAYTGYDRTENSFQFDDVFRLRKDEAQHH
jgi:hypothetical protein